MDIETIAKQLKQGDRLALSKAITLAESMRLDHQEMAQKLIQKLLSSPTTKAKRIAITGVPGVGKSTFIESFGKKILSHGHKVAVLAIDPSSSISGGSILGDKTRMEDLAREKNAYIRPSATAGNLGGVAARTYEAMLLCEAAGFNVILIETVGVGQSETLVNNITDVFLYLQLPGAGDELQGIKRGIMEMSDLIFVNKIDSFKDDKARETHSDLIRSVQFLPNKKSNWKRKIMAGSGLKGIGLDDIWEEVNNYYDLIVENGYLEKNRKAQKQLRIKEYILEEVDRKVKDKLKQNLDWNTINDKSAYENAKKWSEDNIFI